MKLTYTKTLKQRKAKAAHYKVMMGKAVFIGNMNMLRKYADMYEAYQKGTQAYEK